MIADMICGPAFMVMARGMMARFMALAPLVLSLLRYLAWPTHPGAPTRL
jgi:hypothetical protein